MADLSWRTWARRMALAATAAGMLFAAPAHADPCQSGETVIRFSHVVTPAGNPKGDAAARLAARINAEMDGRACMQVFANAQLFDDDAVMEALLLGRVELAAPSLAKLEAYTLKYRLFDLPFLFKDAAAVDRFLGSEAGGTLLGAMRDLGFRGLAYWNSGLKQFSANRPLLLPADAAGLKFRIQPSDVAEAMISALGGTALRLPFRETRDALASGQVDGQENTWSNIYTQRFFAAQDGITETNHQLLAYLLVTSESWLNSLPGATRDQFLAIVAEVSAEANASVQRIERENRDRIVAAGVPIRALTSEQRQVWVEAMRPVWERFEGDIGRELIDAALDANRER
ncbi:DctP family TRAP transporter solute-binding subunit [Microvirga tunisiensis]|uniref:DctP family TRAP transporter solute-binding subunit n=2 Tax=Pannonibacter tanglangensis TaxID=2750084 RepID=A0ABW9ZM84_9HYPH|nr:DctP family TRAP transporter solute-binding subunit [Pannonibacter sp. XCT-34]